jgi:hypothetical protein
MVFEILIIWILLGSLSCNIAWMLQMRAASSVDMRYSPYLLGIMLFLVFGPFSLLISKIFKRIKNAK